MKLTINVSERDIKRAMVLFDCPEKKPTGFQQIKYGTLRADCKDTLAKGFAECFRVLRPGGFLIFKWNEHDVNYP